MKEERREVKLDLSIYLYPLPLFFFFFGLYREEVILHCAVHVSNTIILLRVRVTQTRPEY